MQATFLVLRLIKMFLVISIIQQYNRYKRDGLLKASDARTDIFTRRTPFRFLDVHLFKSS